MTAHIADPVLCADCEVQIMGKIYLWRDGMGKLHKIPEGSCVICEHCTDIFIDPFRGNEIYNCYCDHKDTTECSRNCSDFVLCLEGVEGGEED